MSDINSVVISGRFTRDPGMRYSPAGTAVCNIGMASGQQWKDKNTGEKKEDTTFVDITAFGAGAEFLGRYARKGARAIVKGKLKLDQWQDKNTGDRRSKLSITGDDVSLIDWPDDSSGGEQRHAQQNQHTQSSAPHIARTHAAGPANVDDDDIPF